MVRTSLFLLSLDRGFRFILLIKWVMATALCSSGCHELLGVMVGARCSWFPVDIIFKGIAIIGNL